MTNTELCLACGADITDYQVRPYRSKTPHGQKIFGQAWLHECPACHLVQTMPRPTLKALTDYYAVDYRNGCFAGSDVADLNKFPKDNLFYYNRGLSITQLIAPYITKENPQILDIGAGYGHILHALGEQFPKADRYAIEFSEVCVHHLRSLGVEVSDEAVEEALPQLNKKFDLIVLSHVFEHLLDPCGTLKLIREHLAPDGILYIEVPHIPADALRRYPDHVWAPRFEEPHISLFSVSTLNDILTSAGYNVQFCDTAGGEYKYISALQFHLPHWRWFLQSLMPEKLFHFLRNQSLTQSMRVPEIVPSFYEYGGNRIWIRSVSKLKTAIGPQVALE